MKALLLGLTAITACCFAQDKEVSLNELGDILPAVQEYSSLVLRVNPGDTLPIHFDVGGTVLALEGAESGGRIVAKEPLYIKIEPSFLFSQDKKEWKPFETFFTGMVGASLTSTGETAGALSLQLNKR